MLGRDDLMWDCTQLVSVSLVTSRDQRDPAGDALTGDDPTGDAPDLCQPEIPQESGPEGCRWTVCGDLSLLPSSSPPG